MWVTTNDTCSCLTRMLPSPTIGGWQTVSSKRNYANKTSPSPILIFAFTNLFVNNLVILHCVRLIAEVCMWDIMANAIYFGWSDVRWWHAGLEYCVCLWQWEDISSTHHQYCYSVVIPAEPGHTRWHPYLLTNVHAFSFLNTGHL